jgi:hypothetical protein
MSASILIPVDTASLLHAVQLLPKEYRHPELLNTAECAERNLPKLSKRRRSSAPLKPAPLVGQLIDGAVYTVDELAQWRKLHRTTIRKLFIDEPSVERLGHAAGRKRQYYTLRIPGHVARRVFGRMAV